MRTKGDSFDTTVREVSNPLKVGNRRQNFSLCRKTYRMTFFEYNSENHESCLVKKIKMHDFSLLAFESFQALNLFFDILIFIRALSSFRPSKTAHR